MRDNTHLKVQFRRLPQRLFLSLFLAPLFFSPGLEAAPLSFEEVFQTARKKVESIGIRESSTRQSEERVSQLEGAIYPNLSLIGTYTRQDNSRAGTLTQFSDPNQYSARFNLVQPIFQGLREWAELRSAKLLRKAEELRLSSAVLALYSRVAQSYYGVLGAEKDLANLKSLIGLTDQRVKELSERVKIGRSRRGEMLAAQSQAASLKAQAELAEAQVDQARNDFALATGLPKDTVLVEAKDTPEIKLKSLEEYLQTLPRRPDVEAQSARVESSEEKVDSAWGEHSPTIAFVGNYYLTRTGILKDTKWDIGLTLTLPIFSGGAIQSRVRDAQESEKSEKLTLALVRRTAEKEIRDAHQYLSRVIQQNRRLEDAVKLSEDNYKEQNRDYRYGLVTNLDVLQALNVFQENKRLLDRSVMQIYTAWASLSSATGTLP